MRRLLAAALLLGLGCGSPEPAPRKAPPARPQPAAPAPDPRGKGLTPGALAAYDAARPAVGAGRYADAEASLRQATELAPDFTEAWYNLGATESHLAIEAIRGGDEAGALAWFRSAVDHKRKAQELIDQGRWYVYLTAEEQDQVKSDLLHALEDADPVLADEESLLVALRLWAGAGE